MFCLIASTSLWSWPPGLRTSSSFFFGWYLPTYRIASFGDSVASGFNSDFWLSRVKGGTYADHFGRTLNDESKHSVKVRNLAWAGFTLGEILSAILKSHTSRIQEADLIFLEGGGNDFLDLYDQKYIDLCKPENFYPALNEAKKNYLTIMNDVVKYRKTKSAVKVLGMYYPLINETRKRPCQLTRNAMAPTVHLAFLNALAKFNWFASREAKKRGFTYVDVLAHMNCAKKNWSTCKLNTASSEAEYLEKLLSIDAKGILKDPNDLGWTQDDHVHPNTEGHQLIAWTIRNS